MSDDYAPVISPDDALSEEERRRQLATAEYPPPAPSPAPASLAASPKVGSLEDLEAKADEPRALPAAAPSAPRPQWKDYAPAEPHGWSKFGHIAASLSRPSDYIVNQRPLLNAERNYKAATAEYEAPIAEQEKEAQTEHAQSQSELEHQQAETLRKTGGQKQGLAPEETTIHDLMTGENGGPRMNPQTGKPYSYLEAYGAINQAKQDAKPDPAVKDKQQDIEDYLAAHKLADTPENREKARGEIAGRGKQEPGNFMPLYDEKGHVSGAWDPKSGRVVRTPEGALPGTTGQGAHIGEQANAAATKEAQPYQQMIDNAAQARQLAEMAGKGNASADVDLVLSFFKMMKGNSGAGLRFTQQEQNLILGARSAGQGLIAIGQKVVGEGQPLTPEQRQHMVDVIDMHAKAAQQHLEAMKGGQGAARGSAVYAKNPKTGERVVSKDGGKTWEKVAQ